MSDHAAEGAAPASTPAETDAEGAAASRGPSWQTVPASEIQPGDHIRTRSIEIQATRIDVGFLGTPGFLAFVEDLPSRWIKIPAAPDAEVEVEVPRPARENSFRSDLYMK